MARIASDLDNPDFVGARPADSALHVTFYQGSNQNNFKSEAEGRPIFEPVDMVRIMTPGNALNIVETFARDDHKRRFPHHWKAYKERISENDQTTIGTPIEEWPLLSKAQADEFKAIKFMTVESVAGASDQQLKSIGMVAGKNIYLLRDQAMAFLKIAEVSAKNAEADRRIDDAKTAAADEMKKLSQQSAIEIAKLKEEHKIAMAQQMVQFEEMMKRQSESLAAQIKGSMIQEKPQIPESGDGRQESPQNFQNKAKGPAKSGSFIPA